MKTVVALTGTDHHHFERMVAWVDEAATRLPEVRFVVQHGATRPPVVAEGHAYFPEDRLAALLSEASAVVCHGGPGTIMDAREAGHVPLCVPRDPRLGEHVDGHQLRFAALVGGAGVVRVVTSIETFHQELDRALAQTRSLGAAHTAFEERDAARARVADELDGLLSLGRRHPSRVDRTRTTTRGSGATPSAHTQATSGTSPAIGLGSLPEPEPQPQDAGALSPPRTALTG